MADDPLDFKANLGPVIKELGQLDKALRGVNKAIISLMKSANAQSSLDKTMKKSADEAKKVNDQLDKINAKLTETQRRRAVRLLPAPDPRDLTAVLKYSAQIDKIGQLIKKIDPNQLKNLLGGVTGRSVIDPETLTKPAREMLLLIQKARNEAARIKPPPLNRLGLQSSLNAQFKNDRTADIQTQRSLANAKARLVDLVSQSKLTNEQILAINNNLGASYVGLKNKIAQQFIAIQREYDKLTAAVKKSADEQARLNAPKKNLGALSGQLTIALGGSRSGSDKELRRYKDAQRAILDLYRTNDITAKRILTINNKLGESYTGLEQKIARALIKMRDEYNKLGTAAAKAAAEQQKVTNKQAGDFVGNNLRGRISGSFGAKDSAKINADIARVTDLVNRGKISIQEYQRVLATVGSGAIGNFTKNQTLAANAITRLIETVSKAGGKMKGFEDATTKLDGAVNRARNTFTNFHSVVSGIFVGQLLYTGISRIRQEIASSVTEAARLSKELAEIQTIGRQQVSDQGITDNLRRLSETYSQDISETSSALYAALTNQVGDTVRSLEFLEEAGRFSQASVSSLSGAVNLGSAALNAYNLSAKDSQEIFASLFKTKELGRIKVDELGQSFGRILPLSNKMGVSVDELNAALATITIQGVPQEEAMTQLTNLFTQAARPTKQMTELLDDYGERSVQAFIKSRGFLAFLQALDKEIGNDVESVRKFSREIRATNALLNLTGDNLQTYSANLGKYVNKMEDYDKAVEDVAASLGLRFQNQMDAVKNFFALDIGTPLLSMIVKTGEAMGGFVPLIKGATIALGAYAIAATAVGGAAGVYTTIQLMNAALTTNIVLTKVGTAGLLAFHAALAVPVGVGLGVVIAHFGEKLLKYLGVIDDWNEKIKSFSANIREAAEGQKAFNTEFSKQSVTDFSNQFDIAASHTRKSLAVIRYHMSEMLDDIETTAESQADKLKIVFNNFSGFAVGNIRQVDREINKMKSELETIDKSLPKIAIDNQLEKFDRSRSLATSDRQTNRINQQQIQFLQRQGKDLLQKGNFSEAQDAFKDINSLLNDQFSKQVELNKEAGRSPRFGIFRIEQAITKNQQDQLRLTQQAIALERKQLAEAEKKKIAYEKALQSYKLATDALIKLENTDFTKFKTPEDARGAITKAVSDARQSVGVFDPKDQLAIISQVVQFESAIRQKAETQLLKLRTDNRAKEIDDLQLRTTEAYKVAADGLQKLQNEKVDLLTPFRLQATELQNEFTKALTTLTGYDSPLQKGFAQLGLNAANELSDAIANNTITPELLADLDGRIDAARKALLVRPDSKGGAAVRAPAIDNQPDVIVPLAQLNPERLQAINAGIATLNTGIRELKQKLIGIGDTDITNVFNYKAGEEGAARLFQTIVANYEKINNIKITPNIDLTKANSDIDSLLFRFQQLQINLQKPVRAPLINEYHGGRIPRFNTGGQVGADSVVGALSPGEMVINQRSTQRMFSRLVSANAGRTSGFDGGSGDSVTIGDINVTLQGTGKNEADGREIGNYIDRQVRKGNIRRNRWRN